MVVSFLAETDFRLHKPFRNTIPKRLKKTLLVLCGLVLIAAPSFGQAADDALRTRAGVGEYALRKHDFSKVNMSHIAVIHLTDYSFGYFKTALTVFGNDKASYPIPISFKLYADSLIKNNFESLTMTRFTVIKQYPTQNQFPFMENKGFKSVTTENAKAYFEMLRQQGFDGLLVLNEKFPIPNLIPGHAQYGPLPPKGIYQYMGHQYIYHAIGTGLYDLRTGTPVKNIGYLQFSADDYPSKEKPILPITPYIEMLQERLRNNIEQILLVHKMH